MHLKKQLEWARKRRQAARAKRRPAPIVEPVTTTPKVVWPVEVVEPPKASGPKPKTLVSYRLPYLKKKDKFICEVCLYELKTEEGMIRHVQAKHPEVKL